MENKAWQNRVVDNITTEKRFFSKSNCIKMMRYPWERCLNLSFFRGFLLGYPLEHWFSEQKKIRFSPSSEIECRRIVSPVRHLISLHIFFPQRFRSGFCK